MHAVPPRLSTSSRSADPCSRPWALRLTGTHSNASLEIKLTDRLYPLACRLRLQILFQPVQVEQHPVPRLAGVRAGRSEPRDLP